MSTANEPAFPLDEINISNGHWEGRYEIERQLPGLTKRELFAAIALHGYLSGRSADARGATRETVAVGCVAYADALLAELERKVPNERRTEASPEAAS